MERQIHGCCSFTLVVCAQYIFLKSAATDPFGQFRNLTWSVVIDHFTGPATHLQLVSTATFRLIFDRLTKLNFFPEEDWTKQSASKLLILLLFFFLGKIHSDAHRTIGTTKQLFFTLKFDSEIVLPPSREMVSKIMKTIHQYNHQLQ